MKYEKADLNKVIDEQCQHLSPNEQERFIHILETFGILFDGTLGTWKTPLVNFYLNMTQHLCVRALVLYQGYMRPCSESRSKY